jgi:glutathione S-transferase
VSTASTTAHEIILHHYPRSPFAEKVRLALGLKRLRWRSVIQPRLAPKPALTPLTGGYRRIPVMQIGAEIYCDTRRILAELDRRFPEPPLCPVGGGAAAAIIAAWADRFLFADALGLVFGLQGDRFPPELHADRARFTAGKFDGWDSARMKAKLPALRDHFRLHLAWLESLLSDGRAFLVGPAPSLADLAAYHPLWYARGNLGEEASLVGHPRLLAWMARLDAVGHGDSAELAPEAALDIARDALPTIMPDADPDDPNRRRPGERLTITPEDWGFDVVVGELVSSAVDAIALRREDHRVGTVVVNFPLAGFVVAPAD